MNIKTFSKIFFSVMHNFFLISEDPHKIWFNDEDIRKFFASAAVIKMVKNFFIKKKNNFSGSEIFRFRNKNFF